MASSPGSYPPTDRKEFKMAVLNMDFFSPALQTNTQVTIIIPTPDSYEQDIPGGIDYFQRGIKYQVLYLLHGLCGDHTNWTRYTSIERYVQSRRLMVVMPMAGNSFYQDMYLGPQYLTYITEELPRYIETLFPVTGRREDTFVAGLSMGGYGAVKCAFHAPERYIACASLSGALDVEAVMDMSQANKNKSLSWEMIFEDPEAARHGEANLYVLAQKRQAEGRPLPRVFQTVGTEDYLYPSNQIAREKLKELGVDLTYTEHPGIHEWSYWDAYIQEALDWMGLKGEVITE